MFNLKTPCKDCPFLKDTPTLLHEDRLPHIARDLDRGSVFYCHKTIDYDTQFENDEDGKFTSREQNQFCAGALIFLEKQGKPNQPMRIAERLGLYDRTTMKGHDRVIDNLDERRTYQSEKSTLE